MDRLWSERFLVFARERATILSRLANGFAFLPVFFILLGLYYYPIFLQWLPEQFPVAIFFAIILTWSVSRGLFRSLLLESDSFYLIAIEEDLRPFFLKSFFYNWIVQSFFVLLVVVILSPLFFARISSQMNHLLVFVLVVLVLKAVNVMIVWIEVQINTSYFVVRFAAYYLITYALIIRKAIPFILGTTILLLLIWRIKIRQNFKVINWLQLIEMEQLLNTRFYNWMGQFIDHSQTVTKVKQRRILNFWLNHMIEQALSPYSYLYLKLFSRTEHIGIIFRLSLIGTFVLWFVRQDAAQYVLYLSFLFMLSVQIAGFWHAYKNHLWYKLHPLSERDKVHSFLSMSYSILLVFSLILLIPVFIQRFALLKFAFLIGSAVLIPFIFMYKYLGAKMIK